MPIRAVVFDVGGVLELTPSTGWLDMWTSRLGLQTGEPENRLADVWRAGALGQITEAEVAQTVGIRLGLDPVQVHTFIDDLWTEYLGTLNSELADYYRDLRPAYRTAIISNSFVGAREKEQARYQFDTICDFIVYSHEVGVEKPERRIFELTWNRLGVLPGEIIFLDDFEPHVQAARPLGMHGAVFRNTAQAIAAIQALLNDPPA